MLFPVSRTFDNVRISSIVVNVRKYDFFGKLGLLRLNTREMEFSCNAVIFIKERTSTVVEHAAGELKV